MKTFTDTRFLVEYRLLNPDGSQWGAIDPVEFDTTYSMVGHPYRIFTGGEWWVAAGGFEVETLGPDCGSGFVGRRNYVFAYKQEAPET